MTIPAFKTKSTLAALALITASFLLPSCGSTTAYWGVHSEYTTGTPYRGPGYYNSHYFKNEKEYRKYLKKREKERIKAERKREKEYYKHRHNYHK